MGLVRQDPSVQQVQLARLANKACRGMLVPSVQLGNKVSEDPPERSVPQACRVSLGQADWLVQQACKGLPDNKEHRETSVQLGRAVQ